LKTISLRIFRHDLQTIRTRKATVTWGDLDDEKVDKETGKREKGTGEVEVKQGIQDFAAVLQQLARANPSFPLDGAPSPTVGRRTSAGLSDRALLRVARVYERATLAERPVTAAVATAMTLSPSKARDAISRARYLGFLLPTKKGKGGGLLTEKARKLLPVKKHKGGKHHGTKR
jgi:hypothetical protein